MKLVRILFRSFSRSSEQGLDSNQDRNEIFVKLMKINYLL